MVRYKIGARIEGSTSLIFADNQSDKLETATNFSIWYGADHFPAFANTAIVYQIFIDRFNPGTDATWQDQSDLRTVFGGTINGVREKLPYIQSMGFNTIWLTPIFKSPSHHGYDVTDYYQLDPGLGTLEDFENLLSEAHALGMKVILDFVANHCSNQHPFFQDALHLRESRYHDWFVWKTWPDYESFFNVRSMPKLDLSYGKPARKYLLDCAQYWLRNGLDGFRLDYAQGPEQDFWVDFRKACSQINSEAWTFGEIIQPADVQLTYPGGLWGSLDFLLCQAFSQTFGTQRMNLGPFAAFLASHYRFFPENFSLPAFIDNHDMNRFLFLGGGDEGLLQLVLLILYCLPGPPIVYYGTEVPMSQRRSIHVKGASGFDEARLAMPWEEVENSSFTGYLRLLAEIRAQNPSMLRQPWQVILSDEQRDLIVLGQTGTGGSYILINRSAQPAQIAFEAEYQRKFQDSISGKVYQCMEGKLQIAIEPVSAILLLAR
jgi:glycosidase